jgi:hypothetical protein
MIDWLKTILGESYTEDIDKKVSAEIGKDFVSRADFNTANEAKKTLDAQIKDRDKQLDELKKVDAAGLQAKITELQTANETAKTEYDNNLKKITVNSKIETALLGAKARDVKAARALLDESKISLDGDNVLGLTDQLTELQKDKGWLFGEEKPNNPPAPSGGTPPATPDLNTTDMTAYKAARSKI